MRLIDADALAAQIRQEPTVGMYTEEILEIIGNAPTIEAAPVVHGRWRKYHRLNCGIKKDDGFTAGCCGRWNKVQTAYCPNCGARMDGDSKAPTTHTTGSNYQSCKHCNSTFIGLEEYAECPVCGQPFEEDANG